MTGRDWTGLNNGASARDFAEPSCQQTTNNKPRPSSSLQRLFSKMKVRLQPTTYGPFQFLFPAIRRSGSRALSTPTLRPSNPARNPSASAPAAKNARWLSDIKARIGKCVMFGMSPRQARQAAAVLKAVGEEWRALVAGREGFLVGRKRAGLLRQRVVWGEMDRMVCCCTSPVFGETRAVANAGCDRSMSTTLCTLDMRSLRGSTGRTTMQCMLIQSTEKSGWNP